MTLIDYSFTSKKNCYIITKISLSLCINTTFNTFISFIMWSWRFWITIYFETTSFLNYIFYKQII